MLIICYYNRPFRGCEGAIWSQRVQLLYLAGLVLEAPRSYHTQPSGTYCLTPQYHTIKFHYLHRLMYAISFSIHEFTNFHITSAELLTLHHTTHSFLLGFGNTTDYSLASGVLLQVVWMHLFRVTTWERSTDPEYTSTLRSKSKRRWSRRRRSRNPWAGQLWPRFFQPRNSTEPRSITSSTWPRVVGTEVPSPPPRDAMIPSAATAN